MKSIIVIKDAACYDQFVGSVKDATEFMSKYFNDATQNFDVVATIDDMEIYVRHDGSFTAMYCNATPDLCAMHVHKQSPYWTV